MTDEQKKKMMKQRRCCKSSRQRHLPEDVIFEILLRLSTKSLCRFQSVSRLWRSMMQSPSFVSAYRARSANIKLLFCQYDGQCNGGDSHLFSTAYPIPIPIPSPAPENNAKEASSCWRSHGRTPARVFASEGGLICSFNYDRSEIHVANPITGERISSRTPPLLLPEFYLGYAGCAVCFGYDPVENKHKVLVVRAYLVSDKLFSTVDIFTVGGAEAWRRMVNPSGLPDLLCFLRMNSICIDGTIYIIGMGPDDNPKFWLVSFDVRMETFRAIPVPAEASSYLYFCLFGFGGAPTFIERPYKLLDKGDGEVIKFRAWKVDDFCRQLWSYRDILLSSSSFSYPLDFAGVTSHGEVILCHIPRKESTVTLYIYRLEDSTIKTIYRPNTGHYQDLTAFYHIENLQPLRDMVPTTATSIS